MGRVYFTRGYPWTLQLGRLLIRNNDFDAQTRLSEKKYASSGFALERREAVPEERTGVEDRREDEGNVRT